MYIYSCIREALNNILAFKLDIIIGQFTLILKNIME